ncbi:hypothetical protein B296_00026275 [Ensete ventricosum]|uniref:Uncharacterized protein n=1 Tax=Ensete ventricosum TaxID=4639 RepID=A0A426Z135_ENSVE|nr:hypothetical protein B296_00026275 [Ensete ventricosum]
MHLGSDSVGFGYRWVLRKEERRIKGAAVAAAAGGTASEDEKRKREIEGKEESMEGKKPSPSTSEELVLRKNASSSSLPSPPGYFSSIFPPASTACFPSPPSMRRSLRSYKGAPPPSDLYWTLNKNCRAGAQTANSPSGDAGAIFSSPVLHRMHTFSHLQSTDGRSQGTNDRDVKLLHPMESTESSCFGSSVHYGGRDFYVSPPPSIDASEASKSVSHNQIAIHISTDAKHGHTICPIVTLSYFQYKHEGRDLDAATRGDWWQGDDADPNDYSMFRVKYIL